MRVQQRAKTILGPVFAIKNQPFFFMKKLLPTSCLALGLTCGLFAATVNPFSAPAGAATGANKLSFDSELIGTTTFGSAPLSISGTGGAQVVFGSSGDVYAAPFLEGSNNAGFGPLYSGPDSTAYLSTGVGSITFEFAAAQNYFGLLWGSVDDYNSLEFWLGDSLLATITGTDVWALANGDRSGIGTFYVNIHADADVWFDKVVASSSQYAFEIDNIAYGVLSVPDGGATFALLGLSLACLICFRRKAA